jgi:hypothetical protein
MQVQWQAWAQELNVLGLAITEMASKIHTVGTNYSTADSANVRNCRMHRAAAVHIPRQGAGTTTMVWTQYALGCGGQAGHRCMGVIQPIRVTVTK